MESIWEAYADSASPTKSKNAHVNFFEDDGSDGDDLDFVSKEGYSRDANFDKALLKFYMSNKVKWLKRKLTSSRVDKFKKQKLESNEPVVFTQYSGKYFCSIAKSLNPHQVSVIQKYGAGCFLEFEKTDVPLRLVKWIAGKFDTRTSEIQLPKNFIPVTKQTIHNILELPTGGMEILPDRDAGRSFIFSHFNVTSIPQVSYFGNKLKSKQELSDKDIFICFMSVVFQSFLCPNSSLQPSSEYMHIFRDPENFMKYDLSKFIYDWLVMSIKKFRRASKHASRRQITLGGNHYNLAVAYLDNVDFGLKSLPNVVPRVLMWKENIIRDYADLDKFSGNSYGKRPLKRLSVSRFEDLRSQDKLQESIAACVQDPEGNFINKLSTMFSSFLTDEQINIVSDIVHLGSTGKPEDFSLCCENVVCNVLSSLYVNKLNLNSEILVTQTPRTAPNRKSDSPTLNFFSDSHTNFSNDGLDFNFSISRGKLASGKYQKVAAALKSGGIGSPLSGYANKENGEECVQHSLHDSEVSEGLLPESSKLAAEISNIQQEECNKQMVSDRVKNKDIQTKETAGHTPNFPNDAVDSYQINSETRKSGTMTM